MRRQAINISLAELLILQKKMIDMEAKLNMELGIEGPINYGQKWLVAIRNETPRCSDTWRLEL